MAGLPIATVLPPSFSLANPFVVAQPFVSAAGGAVAALLSAEIGSGGFSLGGKRQDAGGGGSDGVQSSTPRPPTKRARTAPPKAAAAASGSVDEDAAAGSADEEESPTHSPLAAEQPEATQLNPARRAQNAYILFCNEIRPQLSAQHPKKRMRELTKLMGEMWREMLEDQ
mmetsp:Transcript_44882/g.105086  ORF Transcript_44882/g.105086 Transcript_44882/m.105086 type:complete len:170 (-) Transcript_44882:455-964(-)